MKLKAFLLLLYLLFLSGCSTTIVKENENLEKDRVLTFFHNHNRLSENFDHSLLDNYKDTAKIHANRNNPKTKYKISGLYLKKFGKRFVESARKRGDISTYSNIKVSFSGKQVIIKADRYSKLQNFTDTSYYMVVEKNTKGRYKIVEEYGETKDIISKNSRIEDIIFVLEQRFEKTRKQLPKMVDRNTRFDNVFIKGNKIKYLFTLVNESKDILNSNSFKTSMTSLLAQRICKSSIKSFLKEGIVIEYTYCDKNNKFITLINISDESCN